MTSDYKHVSLFLCKLRIRQLKTMTYSNKSKKVNIYFLRMLKPLVGIECDKKLYTLKLIEEPITTDDYLEMYNSVGSTFGWTDRLGLDPKKLYTDINKDNALIYLLQVDGEAVGYTELVVEGDYIELLYFGLFNDKIGNGYGTHFLQLALAKAWSQNPQWVQLNTCDLDHPKALSLYQSMGFETVETKTKYV